MSKFKVGDKVRLISAQGISSLEKGNIYTVSKLSEDLDDVIILHGYETLGGYRTYRFELVQAEGLDVENSNLIDNQDHYKKAGVEPIELMKQNFTKEEYSGFLQGNIIKYLLRFKRKNGVEDLKKALTYLTWLIEQEEK